jgi:hypothetical protein
MQETLLGTGRFVFAREIDALIAKVGIEIDFFRGREGQVWGTPLHRFLHDGGWDVFFRLWGGEAIQRLAAMPSPELEAVIQSVGIPVGRQQGFRPSDAAATATQ